MLTETPRTVYDYIIAGAGNCGVVVASRLKQAKPSLSIALIEAGKNEEDNELTQRPYTAPKLQGSDAMWNYTTEAQKGLDGRKLTAFTGKMLSGSSSANYGSWTRGHSADYDDWAEKVGDRRWSYEALLPYFRRVEAYEDRNADAQKHGFGGPMRISLSPTVWPLQRVVEEAWLRLGVPLNTDPNGGSPLGLSKIIDNWSDGKRQAAHQVYSLKGVDVFLEKVVQRILLEERDGVQTAATGVELTDGSKIFAKGEVILSCGALKTPQILMLSGIGPKEELRKHGIEQKVDAPEVGKNLHDHPLLRLYYQLRDPARGVAVGSPSISRAEYRNALPVEWIAAESIPADILKAAMIKDGHEIDDADTYLSQPRPHFQTMISYAPLEMLPSYPGVSPNGSFIGGNVWIFLPQSRGSVKLASKDAVENPIIDPNYLGTEVDRVVSRYAARRALEFFQTPEMQEFVDVAMAPDGKSPITLESTDEEIDLRIREDMGRGYHPAGTAALGTVVDAELRFKGVDRLRVVDTSVFPSPLAANYMCPAYAVAEQAADMILSAI